MEVEIEMVVEKNQLFLATFTLREDDLSIAMLAVTVYYSY